MTADQDLQGLVQRCRQVAQLGPDRMAVSKAELRQQLRHAADALERLSNENALLRTLIVDLGTSCSFEEWADYMDVHNGTPSYLALLRRVQETAKHMQPTEPQPTATEEASAHGT
jgi:hypothetical protein